MSNQIERTSEISEGEFAALLTEHEPYNSHTEEHVEVRELGKVTWAYSNSQSGKTIDGGEYAEAWKRGDWVHVAAGMDYLQTGPPWWSFRRDTTMVIVSKITTYYEVSLPGAYSSDYYQSAFAQRISYRKTVATGYYFTGCSLLIEQKTQLFATRGVAEERPHRTKPREFDPTEGVGYSVGEGGGWDPGADLADDAGFDGGGPDPNDFYDDYYGDGIGPNPFDGVSPAPAKLTASWPTTQSVASQRAPLPIIYGTHLLGGNYLWFGNPHAEQNDGETFCVRFLYDIALCTGPVDELVSVQINDQLIVCNKVRGIDGTDFVEVSLSDHESIRFYFGTADQGADPSVLAEKSLGYYPNYKYICHAVVEISITVVKDQAITAPNIYFTVRRTPSCGLSFVHNVFGAANPVDVIYDLMTSPVCEESFSMTDFESASLLAAGALLGNLPSAGGEDFGLHFIFRQSMNVSAAVTSVLEYIHGRLPFNGEKYRLILDRRVDPATLTEITTNDATQFDMQRQATQNVINEVAVTFHDEDNNEKAIRIGPARDTGGQQTVGYRKPVQIQMPAVKNATVAHRAMWRKLREAVYPAAALKFNCSAKLLDHLPGDKIAITNSVLGYSVRPFMLTLIKMGKFPLTELSIEAKEDIWNVTDDSFLELGDLDKWNEGGGRWKKTGLVPVSYAERSAAGVSHAGIKVFELPYMQAGALAEGAQLAVAVSKPLPSTAVGYFLYVSTGEDKTTDYELVGVVREFASQGEIIYNPFGAPMGPHDAAHTLNVARHGFTIRPYCEYDIKYMQRGLYQDVIKRAQIGWVDGEWASIQEIFKDGIAERWHVRGVGRSWFDGENGTQHDIGDEVWILRRGLFVLDRTFDIGDTIYFRAVPFDLFYQRQLSECTALEYQVQGVKHRPFSPINLLARSNGRGSGRIDAIGPDMSPVWDIGDDIVLYWRRRSRGYGIRFDDFTRVLGDTLAHTDGTEEIDVINSTTEVVVRTVMGLNTDTWTYTQAMMAADFGAEPDEVMFRVYQKDVASGLVDALRSAHYAEITVRKM